MRRIRWTVLFLILACPPVGAQTTTDPCLPTPTSLCLNNDRFRVEVEWRDEAGNGSTIGDFDGGGFGRNTPISDVWTGMWFFDPDNLDLLIHVFQGCSFNDRYWVFAGALTNVEVTLTVTDLTTGEDTEYFNPLGQPFAPITDTSAFATCPKSLGPLRPALAPAAPEPPRLAGGCIENISTACLNDERFEVTVNTFGVDQQAQRLADGTAGFLFGNPTFFDVFVSVVDASAANGQYWVKYSAFPDSALNAFTVTVRDTTDGTTRVYQHAPNGPLFVQDQAAFEGDDVITIDGTLSGSWFAAERDGEGFIFDIAVVNGVPTLVLYYFTFENNASGHQAWLVGSAPIIGNKASVPVIIAAGAQFGAPFDPADVDRTDWGNVKVTVLSCDEILIESDSTIFPALSYQAQRLTPAPTGVEGACAASAKAAPDSSGILIDGGYSGSWFRPDRDGEGFIFNIAEIGGVNTLVVFYFTYENNSSGRQAWLVGSAPIVGNVADVPVIVASGTQFGDGFDPNDVVRTPAGNVKVTWQSCTQATVEVSGPLGSLSFDIMPLTGPPIGATGACAP